MSNHSILTQAQANSRYKLFGDDYKVNYDITLHMSKGSSCYRGLVSISFTLQNTNSELFIDFFPSGTIEQLIINNELITTTSQYKDLQKDLHLFLPTDKLRVGSNILTILFNNDYSKGKGIYRFTDTDSSELIYTLSEPYYANKILPCFDQPDLKATFSLSLITHKSWINVSNEKLSKTLTEFSEEILKDFKPLEDEVIHYFVKTPPISTYLFVVIAGDYKEIVCPEKLRDIEFKLYVRPSLYKAVLDQG